MIAASSVSIQQALREKEALLTEVKGRARNARTALQRSAALKQAESLLQEIAALKASLHYAKTRDKLAAEIEHQRRVVAFWTQKFQQSTAANRLNVGQRLRQEAKELEQMLAAAKLQALGEEKAAEADGQLAQVLQFSASAEATTAPAADTEVKAQAELDEWASDPDDTGDGEQDDSESVWYKNPLVLAGIGLAAILFLRR